MKRNLLIIGALVITGIIALGAYVLRPPAEATTPIEAIPLVTSTTAPLDAPAEVNPPQATQAEEAAYPEPEPVEETVSYPAPEQAAVQIEEAYPAPQTSEGTTLFTIVQAESEVRFTLTELLRNVPTTVIGVTDQVAGQILVDMNNLTASQLGVIQVNARTLVTDNTNRNRMIRNEILDTEPYEFITFSPTGLTGLPAAIVVNDTITFQITGDLTIRDITKSVTFDATVSLVSTDRLEGLASVTVLRSDFELVIPSVPQVANVSEEVLVEIEFVAAP